MNIVLNPTMDNVAILCGLPPLHNRIEDAEVEAGIDANRTVQDQRQAANEGRK
jgi:hypothetical protein